MDTEKVHPNYLQEDDTFIFPFCELITVLNRLYIPLLIEKKKNHQQDAYIYYDVLYWGTDANIETSNT